MHTWGDKKLPKEHPAGATIETISGKGLNLFGPKLATQLTYLLRFILGENAFLWFHKYDYIYLGLSRINPCVNAGETSSTVEHSFFSRNYVITFWVTVNSQLACFGSSQRLLCTWYCIELGATCIACKCGQHFVLLAPSGATWIGFKFSHQMAPHALVPILATRWRFLH